MPLQIPTHDADGDDNAARACARNESQGKPIINLNVFSIAQNLWPKFLRDRPGLFNSYAPQLFRTLRSCFGIEEADFTQALLGSADPTKHHFSEGASGSFFYLTENGLYMVKTLKEKEKDLLVKILPDYVRHMQRFPHSLLCRFFGLYSIKMYEQTGIFLGAVWCIPSAFQLRSACATFLHLRSAFFVIMNNILAVKGYSIDEKFDIKGSSINRHGHTKVKSVATKVVQTAPVTDTSELIFFYVHGYRGVCIVIHDALSERDCWQHVSVL